MVFLQKVGTFFTINFVCFESLNMCVCCMVYAPESNKRDEQNKTKEKRAAKQKNRQRNRDK